MGLLMYYSFEQSMEILTEKLDKQNNDTNKTPTATIVKLGRNNC